MDSEQLADLFRRYGDDVFRLAYSYLGSRAESGGRKAGCSPAPPTCAKAS